MPNKPALLLFPNLLDEKAHHEVFLPASVDRAVQTIDGLIAESPKGGRRFLQHFSFAPPKSFADIPISLLNEHTKKEEIDELLKPILKGERWGLVADCGMPCLADPGSTLVFRAREQGIAIQAFVGPSSITLALMLSGLQGQRFCFHGYLEKESADLIPQIQSLESQSRKEKMTQIFIETPYRSQRMLEHLLHNLHDSTLLCAAWDLTMPTQGVVSQAVKNWKKMSLPNIDKKPTVFLFFS